MLVIAGCKEERAAPERGDGGASLGQRVFLPSPGLVRAVPPHGIQAGGVGPYQLGAELRDILAMLPHGPRIELLEIEDIAKYSLVRAEGDRVIIGVGASGRVLYIAVLEPEIAVTAGGLGVGASVDELRERLGPEVPPGPGARDPDILELERLPNARVIVRDGRAVAIVVGPGGAPAATAPTEPDALSGGAAAVPAAAEPPPRPARPERQAPCARAAEILAAAPLAAAAPEDRRRQVAFGCFTGTSPEAVVPQGDEELVLYGGEPSRLRRITSIDVPGLVFAGAIDVDGDMRHELLAVSQKRTGEVLSVRAAVLRVESGRLVSVADEEVYRVTRGAIAWVGARLEDVAFLLRGEPGGGGVEVRGFYLDGLSGTGRHVVPLDPRTISVRPRRRSAEPAGGAGGAGATPGLAGEEAAAGPADASEQADAGPGPAGSKARTEEPTRKGRRAAPASGARKLRGAVPAEQAPEPEPKEEPKPEPTPEPVPGPEPAPATGAGAGAGSEGGEAPRGIAPP